MRAYVNMVSSAPPADRGEYETSVVGVAIAVENNARELIHTVVARLTPSKHVDSAWMARYGISMAGQEDADLPAWVATEIMAVLIHVDQAVAHFAGFHSRQLGKLLLEGFGPIDTPHFNGTWFDTMNQAAPVCKIPAKKGNAWKSPSLAEATLILTGSPLMEVNGLPWRLALLTTLSAVRSVYWQLNGHGNAPLIEEVDKI